MNTEINTTLHSSDSDATAERLQREAGKPGKKSSWLTRLVPVAAVMALVTPAIAGQSRTAHVIVGGKIIATGKFVAGADRFEVTKNSHTVGHRAYLDWKYITKNADLTEGRHWGSSRVGHTEAFDHNFGKDRKVAFRICVQKDIAPDPCSDWEHGFAG
jgi:hypothetical protein